jgi:lipopolysaccharide transport system ATP-binding protein
MSDIAISIDGLSKQYCIGSKQEGYKTLRDTLAATLVSPLRRVRSLLGGQAYGASELSETIWALKNVSFEIKRGEVIGIIGRNGAGKTTLLKILSRITEPTEGQAEIHGRVGSLLEVGTGFHPELTGRENIYLNGAILGMKKVEIERKFPEIVAFAETEKFIDTPVKHYSSGMYVRLAFAVAAHLEPEILLVDEVLAVGDAAFQKKCLGKMGDVASEGRTVLFVSHNMQAVRNLCNKVILLSDGCVEEMGDTGRVVSRYLRGLVKNSPVEQNWEHAKIAPGNERIRLHRIRLQAQREEPSDVITIRTQLEIEVEYTNLVPDTHLIINLALYTIDGSLIFVSLTTEESEWHGRPFPRGLFRSICRIPGNFLNEGTYRVRLLFLDDEANHLYDHEEAIIFTVYDTEKRTIQWYGKWQGIVRPKFEWNTKHIESKTDKDLVNK